MLQSHISEVDFADNPNFADLTLFPMLSLGHNVRIVAGFLPSYVTRTVSYLSKDASADMGTFSLVFCLPAQQKGEADLETIAKTLLSRSQVGQIREFIGHVLTSQELEHRLKIQFLIPTHGAVITNSAIGLITDRVDQNKLVGFIDEFAGDDNSPIHLARTWRDDELDVALRFEDLVHAAENDSWSMVRRVSDIDYRELLDVLSALPDIASQSIAHESPKTDTESESHILRTPVISETEQPTPDVAADTEFNELLELLELADGDSEDLIAMFYGDLSRVKDLHDFITNRNREARWGRAHAGPAGADVLSLIGDAENTCWCGNEYSIREGCANYYSAGE